MTRSSSSASVGVRRRPLAPPFAHFSSLFQMAKLAKMKVAPCEMFRSETDKYSRFDEKVQAVCFSRLSVAVSFPLCRSGDVSLAAGFPHSRRRGKRAEQRSDQEAAQAVRGAGEVAQRVSADHQQQQVIRVNADSAFVTGSQKTALKVYFCSFISISFERRLETETLAGFVLPFIILLARRLMDST